MPQQVREKYFIAKDAKVYKARGCNACQNSGYKGRTVLSEYLPVTPKIRALASASASEHTIKREARLSGMHTLREDGLIKMSKGITTLEEVLKVTGPDEPL